MGPLCGGGGGGGGGGAAFVVIVSMTCLLPPAPVAVHVQVDGNPTHALLAVPGALPLVGSVPLATKPVPVEVQTRVSEVALVVLQFSVKDWFATIVVGVRVTVSVGTGAGGGGAVTLIWYSVVGAPKNSTNS